MNFKNIANTVTSKLAKTELVMKKHSPEILLAIGIVGVVASGVMACVATTKAGAILDETKEKVDQIHAYEEKHAGTCEYTENDKAKDLAIVYAQTSLKYIKLYAPSVALAALSITSILASNHILRNRNVAISAAYAALMQDYKGYRKRVIDRFGAAIDKELKYGVKTETITETVVDPETGEEKIVEKTVNVVDKSIQSPYARCFDETSRCWEKNPDMNQLFLRSEQNYANERLRLRGFLTLNEVYERLGFPVTKAGACVGWIYDPKNPNHNGDNFVDFGIYDAYSERKVDFVNGYERSIWLDFNVDGCILDKLDSIGG